MIDDNRRLMVMHIGHDSPAYTNGDGRRQAGFWEGGGGGHNWRLYVCDIENVPIGVLDDNRS